MNVAKRSGYNAPISEGTTENHISDNPTALIAHQRVTATGDNEGRNQA